MLKYVLLALFVTGCNKDGTHVTPQNAVDDFEVKKLFTVDGCTVYRFTDGNYHYFTTCKGSVVSRQQQGKSSYSEEIRTDE